MGFHLRPAFARLSVGVKLNGALAKEKKKKGGWFGVDSKRKKVDVLD